VDVLTSDSQNVLDSVLKGFSKTPLEVFWNFVSISISICFCRAQDPRRTFKSYPERDTFVDTELPCQLMAKAAVAQPSPSPSPTKLLVARAEQKGKGKKKAPAKATKAAAKATKATKAARASDEEALDVEIVEDDTAIKCVSYIRATSMSLMLL